MNVTEILKEGWVCPKCGRTHGKYVDQPMPYFHYSAYDDKIVVECYRCDYSILVEPKDKE